MRVEVSVGKLLVYPYEDALIIKKLEVGDAEKKLEAMYRRIEARRSKHDALSEEEINAIVQKYRHGKR